MIELTTSGDIKGLKDAGIVSINEGLIILMQRQHSVRGDDFTALFMMGGMPPYSVVETRAETHEKITEARKLQFGALQ